MPNWCYNQITITGTTNKQLKKIRNILLGKTKTNFNAILPIDYNSLFVLDMINGLLKRDLLLLEEANQLASTFDTNILEVLEYLYTKIRDYKSLDLYIESFEDMTYVFNQLYRVYDKFKEKENTNIPDTYVTYDEINVFNIFPDNPLSLYRKTFITNSGILDYEKSKMSIAIDDWYADRVHNRLGTKWNPNTNSISDEDDIDDSNELYMSLETAWGPCELFCSALSEIFDINIKISYSEEGLCFVGYYEYEDGVCIDHVDYEPNNTIDFKYVENLVCADYEMDTSEILEYITEYVDAIVDDVEDADIIADSIVDDGYYGERGIIDLIKKFPQTLQPILNEINDARYIPNKIKKKITRRLYNKLNKTNLLEPIQLKIRKIK